MNAPLLLVIERALEEVPAAGRLLEGEREQIAYAVVNALTAVLEFDIDRELNAAEKLITVAAQLQSDDPLVCRNDKERESKLAGLRVGYNAFYRRALQTAANFGRGDVLAALKQEYDGGVITPKIRRFLLSGSKHKNGRFTFRYDRYFAEPLQNQLNALAALGGPFDYERDQISDG